MIHRNVKIPMEDGMMGNIDGETFYYFTKNTWIGDSGTFCHITNNNSGLFLQRSVNQFREALVVCQQCRKGSFMSTSHKLMVLKGYTLYGP